MNTDSIKLRTKLGAAFFSLAVLTAGIGGFAITELSNVNASTEEIATSWLPSIKALGQVRVSANQLRRGEGDHVMSLDAVEMDSIEKALNEAKSASRSSRRPMSS
ncbi:MAG: MCP four helix bundle domain-containing protein [Methylibium sp.]|nr:MCP four helix bundle domain-containing protein [Methylibium sp.]